MVTNEQVKLLRRKRMDDTITEQAAAATAGMSQPTARKWRDGALPTEAKPPRTWRTRQDPFESVWTTDVVPLLEADTRGKLKAKTVLGELNQKYPGEYGNEHLRTLQRRIRHWRAIHGPDQEVFFVQDHPPGREGAFDFTHSTELEVTIGGELLVHLLFVFRLAFSGWVWIQVAFGETFEALVEGLQGALWELGGSPSVVRSDNLSAATHELKRGPGRGLNRRFGAVLEHYGLDSSRIKPGKSNENGGVEKGNDLVKTAIGQELMLRGHREFDDVEQYEAFARGAVAKHINSLVERKLLVELDQLKDLPSAKVPNYTKYSPRVSKNSLARVGGRLYSVPSRLRGHELLALQYANVIEVYYRDRLIETMPRLRGDKEVRIDYRHVIWSLVRKPGAFGRYKYREELFPSLIFRRAFDALSGFTGMWADLEYVRILHLAASTMESRVEQALEELLEQGEAFDYARVKSIAAPSSPAVPEVKISEPDLSSYDQLLQSTGGS
jgi:hypothetical protein